MPLLSVVVSASNCLFCNHPNPFGAKYCNECGAPLRMAPCRRCGAVNHITDAECHRCGSPREELAPDAAPVAVALADVAELAAPSKPAMWKPGDFPMPALASLVSNRLEESSRRWRRYLVTALVALIALAVPAGWYLYHHRWVPHGSAAVESLPIQGLPARRAEVPRPPIAALSQSTGGPTASLIDAAVEQLPATLAAPLAAPEARCPAAIEAIALCDWVARAERR